LRHERDAGECASLGAIVETESCEIEPHLIRAHDALTEANDFVEAI
jgi:hypothetical protein